MEPSQAVIPASEVLTIRSTATDIDYQVSVALPFHYDDRPDQTFPVIYVLDGNLYFGLVVDMVRAMNIRVDFCNELPDAFVIGIGYPTTGSLGTNLHTVMHNRMRDFLPQSNLDDEAFIQTHFPVNEPQRAGGADSFFAFLQRQLIPAIDHRYRTNPENRTLLGHSWGGTFAWYSLFRDPPMFQRYVIVSSGAPPEDESTYAHHHHDLPVRLHLVTEQTDPDEGEIGDLLTTLSKRGYPTFDVTAQRIDCTHCAIVPAAFQAGLVAVLA